MAAGSSPWAVTALLSEIAMALNEAFSKPVEPTAKALEEAKHRKSEKIRNWNVLCFVFMGPLKWC